ncbi:MAG: substrate-binding domain-containing protein [Chloroflexota bacterium]
MTIAVIAPFFTRRSYIERLQGVEHVLSSSGYDLVLYNVESVERRNDCLRLAPRRERVDGLLILSLAPSDEEAAHLVNARVPTVLVDAYHSDLSTVQVDDVTGAMTAVNYLIEQGHNRIGYVGEVLDDNPFRFQPIHDRYIGYRQALESAGIAYDPELHAQGRYGWRGASRMTADLLQVDAPPTAIFAYCDTMALGVLEAAQESGRQIPRDLSVIGFDDVEIAQYFQLTTMRQPLYETGARGAELLMELVDSGNHMPVEHIYLPTELVVRRTTTPADTEFE